MTVQHLIAREIVTPRGSATALRIEDGVIAWVGDRADLPADAAVDDRFADAVLHPGFVEAHSHPDSAWLWQAGAYIGGIDRVAPDGTRHDGCRTLAAALGRLRAHAAALPAGVPVLAWGFDPYLCAPPIAPGQGGLDRAALDTVSATAPVFVLHASQHVASVNSVVIAADGLERADAPGIARDGSGRVTGELYEPPAMLTTSIARAALGAPFDPRVLWAFGAEAARAGCTTVTDLDALPLTDPHMRAAYAAAVADPAFPVRLAAFAHVDMTDDDGVALGIRTAHATRAVTTARFRGGFAKLFLDGSIQAGTAALQAPDLLGRTGVWLTEPARFREVFARLCESGVTVHVHGNGDGAARVFADAVEDAAARGILPHPAPALTHAQLADPEDLARIRDAGCSVSFLIGHVRWWGDAEADLILGPDRAARLDAAGTAHRLGLPFSLHSDSPVTPLAPLELIAAAMDRRTSTGRVLGEAERLTASRALAAVTSDAAAQLGMGGLVGQILPGLRADLVALDRDLRRARDGDEVRATAVVGTVLDGRPV